MHLVAEQWPYARTNGLAEAVRDIATSRAAQATRVTVFIPLYRAVREVFPDPEPITDGLRVRVGRRAEAILILQHPAPRRNPERAAAPGGGFRRPTRGGSRQRCQRQSAAGVYERKFASRRAAGGSG